jgi:hemoglobin
MRQTLFERCGGFATVSKVVMSFYDKVLESPATSPYFSRVDMKRLIDHQTKFFAALMGGPASYTNDHLEKVHTRLGITESAFMEALVLMKDTLEEHDFLDEDIRLVQDEMMSRKNYIVAKKQS